jgi:hypothetical protein
LQGAEQFCAQTAPIDPELLAERIGQDYRDPWKACR